MPEPKIIPPDQMGATLRGLDWDTANLGPNPFAHICPLCGSFVAIGGPPNSITYQESHIRHHVWETEGINR